MVGTGKLYLADFSWGPRKHLQRLEAKGRLRNTRQCSPGKDKAWTPREKRTASLRVHQLSSPPGKAHMHGSSRYTSSSLTGSSAQTGACRSATQTLCLWMASTSECSPRRETCESSEALLPRVSAAKSDWAPSCHAFLVQTHTQGRTPSCSSQASQVRKTRAN